MEYATMIDEIVNALTQRNLGHETKLQEILDITNHVANNYHTQFGAAKCRVIRRGIGYKSGLTLNGEILPILTSYKYLWEIINNKYNLSDLNEEILNEGKRSHRHYPSRNR